MEVVQSTNTSTGMIALIKPDDGTKKTLCEWLIACPLTLDRQMLLQCRECLALSYSSRPVTHAVAKRWWKYVD